ncbi:MAG: hypothetical protein CMF62_02665 [Magnetococcales bacterium]|nr:hypothetical protein [Magnetococcales bacterium]|tara:strand:+ start:59626 stop:61002 length:1377 start_codon:yes stop_codon:yes gene_type:complete
MDFNKINRRIDNFIDNDMIDSFLNIELKDKVNSSLLDYQYLHVFNLITSLNNHNVIIDGSDTGTGKTYSALAVCSQLNLRPFIICPKSVMYSWAKVADFFEVKPYHIVNYETIKNGKVYKNKDNIEREDCKFLEVKNKNEYKWNLPKNALLIFDEVHKCKNKNTSNGKLLLSVKDVSKVLLLSATLADTLESFHIFGYLLDFYKSIRKAKSWIESVMRNKKTLNSYIYPEFGSRMVIADLKDAFPKNQVSAKSYNINNEIEKEIDTLFKYVDKKLKLLVSSKVNKEDRGRILAKITKVRMKIERYKVPIFTELAKGFLDEGKSVIIFVNFIKTMFELSKSLNTNCLINGIQTLKERENNIENFQNNTEKIIICIMKTGSQSINLHDIHGNHPRATLISPSFSSVDLTQALGRAYRSGAKTPVLQRIVFSANSCEQVISERLQEKLKFTGQINNEDLLL